MKRLLSAGLAVAFGGLAARSDSAARIPLRAANRVIAQARISPPLRTHRTRSPGSKNRRLIRITPGRHVLQAQITIRFVFERRHGESDTTAK